MTTVPGGKSGCGMGQSVQTMRGDCARGLRGMPVRKRVQNCHTNFHRSRTILRVVQRVPSNGCRRTHVAKRVTRCVWHKGRGARTATRRKEERGRGGVRVQPACRPARRTGACGTRGGGRGRPQRRKEESGREGVRVQPACRPARRTGACVCVCAGGGLSRSNMAY